MLKIISILTLLYFLSSTALPENYNDHNVNQGYKDHNRQPLPLQLAEAASRNYYEAGGKQLKPCSRRKDKDPLDDQGVFPTPTYSARVVTYQGSGNNNFKPQSLKNEPTVDSGEEHYNKLLEQYSHYLNDDKDQTYDSNKVHAKSAQKDKQVKGLSGDNNSEASDRNALPYGEEDNVHAENQKPKAESDELNDNQNAKSLTEKLNDAKKNYKYTKSDNEKVDGDSYEVDNPDANSDKLNAENDKESKELDDSRYNVKNSKNVQAQSKELDDAQTKSSNKFLTVANYKIKSGDADNDKLDAADYGNNKHTENLRDKFSGEHQGDKSSRSQNNDMKGLYNKSYENKNYGDELSDEQDSETTEQKSDYSDELEDALNGVKKNKADSDELNEALEEIKKHLAHSEELKSALREVGRKGKLYSNVLNEALYKVKKHKAQSNELNRNRYGDGSSESDSSDADDSNDQYETLYSNKKYENSGSKNGEPLLQNSKEYHLSAKPVYEGSDLHSQVEDSDENVQNCPSKQQNLEAEQHEGKDSTRRLLSNSKDLESGSLEDVAQNNAKLKNKAKFSNANAVPQKHAIQTNKAKKYDDDEDDQRNSAGNDVLLRLNTKPKFGYDLSNPVQAPGVSQLPPQGLSLMDHRRVCYACSSDFNPLCYEPNRQTTVKYCQFGHDNCITKTYTDPNDNHLVVIRDCGDSCSVGASLTGVMWNSCDVCTDDLCNDKKFDQNGAFSINSQSLVFTVFVIFAIKFTM